MKRDWQLAKGLAAGALLLIAAPTAAQAPAPHYEGWTWPTHPPSDPLPVDTVTALPDEWLARDKALHAGASFLLTLSSQYVWETKLELTEGEALPLAVTSALSLGLFKEVMDSRRPHDAHFCYRDLVADALGVLLGAGLVLL